MAISVDTVYQRILTLANKEQRGYITPQEFNLLANQAQMSIFESYFYSKNQRDRTEDVRSNEVDETDIGELLNNKLRVFSSVLDVANGTTIPQVIPSGATGAGLDVFQTGEVYFGGSVCRKISINEMMSFKRSTRHSSGDYYYSPVYTDSISSVTDINVYGTGATYLSNGIPTQAFATTGVSIEVFRVPSAVSWAYVVVGNNKKALYNATASVDFELHKSEGETLVYKILELAGIVMNKSGLAQTAVQMGSAEQQFQKI
jgi:hypothetical protein